MKARFKIESVIDNLDGAGLPEGDPERNTVYADGDFSLTDGGALISYAEVGEGGRVDSDISLSGDSVKVVRRGAIESEMHFAEGCEHRSVYSVPPYKFDALIRTRRIRTALSESGGTLELIYNMRIGGADKSARMKIWISTNSNHS
jgi:uncharacterized beta-barrel protein YwiB (DUF1934 family)